MHVMFALWTILPQRLESLSKAQPRDSCELQVGQAMLLKPPERPEPCAFVYAARR